MMARSPRGLPSLLNPAQTQLCLCRIVMKLLRANITECCGLFGDIHYQCLLPTGPLVRLSIDPLKGAKLVFLESDAQDRL
jgi:hypothetical protein